MSISWLIHIRWCFLEEQLSYNKGMLSALLCPYILYKEF